MTVDVWGADEVHGEAGDDTVYAGGGNDVVFGDARRRRRHRRLGPRLDLRRHRPGRRPRRRRPDLHQPQRHRRAAQRRRPPPTQQAIATPGSHPDRDHLPDRQAQQDRRPDAVRAEPAHHGDSSDDPLFRPQYANDIIFGGLGDDFLHGGSGDDAISGAEALVAVLRADHDGTAHRPSSRPTGPARSTPATLLGFDAASAPASSRSTTSTTRAA